MATVGMSEKKLLQYISSHPYIATVKKRPSIEESSKGKCLLKLPRHSRHLPRLGLQPGSGWHPAFQTSSSMSNIDVI